MVAAGGDICWSTMMLGGVLHEKTKERDDDGFKGDVRNQEIGLGIYKLKNGPLICMGESSGDMVIWRKIDYIKCVVHLVVMCSDFNHNN